MEQEIEGTPRFGGKHAVVLGGSMAGLITARVLSEHFARVTVVERDALDDGSAEPRKGVPQGRQLHALLKKGETILAELFPDLLPALAADGAVTFDFGGDVAWHHFGVWKKRFDAGMSTTCLSRPLLESHVRRRVFALPNVRRRDRTEVTTLVASADRTRITGAVVKGRDDGDEARLDADLVVDASGRGTRLPGWLSGLGYAPPEETQVKVRVGYASRVFRRVEPSPYPWKSMYLIGKPPDNRRIGALMPQEGGQWICVLVGMLGDYPPDDAAGFLEFARGLPVPDLHRVLEELEPVGDIPTHRFSANLRRHYERLERFPEGLVAVGDALASFNPIFGQGMTTACLDALALGACLVEQRGLAGPGDVTGLSRRYHVAAAKLTDAPWMMTTGEDFRYPEVEGQRPPLYPAMKWYLGQVHRAASVDTEIFGHFLRAMHMLDGPEKLLAPSTALKVLRAARRASPC